MIDVKAAYVEAQAVSTAKSTVHLVVVGHVDAGKSTLMGP
jgi:GTPase